MSNLHQRFNTKVLPLIPEWARAKINEHNQHQRKNQVVLDMILDGISDFEWIAERYFDEAVKAGCEEYIAEALKRQRIELGRWE